jgi:hypothetical protein
MRDTVLAITDDDCGLAGAGAELAGAVVPEARCGYAGKHTAAIHARHYQRRIGQTGPWSRIVTQPVGTHEYVDKSASVSGMVCYRVRAMGADGESAYSNIVRVRR